MLKAVIFDMDGVIIDSEPQHARAAILALKKYDIEITMDYLQNFIGSTTKYMCHRMIEEFHISATSDELLKVNNEMKEQLLKAEGHTIVPYIIDLMKDLHKNQIKLTIASSSPSEAIEEVMNCLHIKEYFNGYVSGMSVKNPKPAPDIFLEAAKSLDVHPSECLVIEDSYHGVTAAKAAGMTCIGFVNPNSGNQDLSKATMLVEGFDEVDYPFINKIYQYDHLEPVTITVTDDFVIRELSVDDMDDLYRICQNSGIRPYVEGFDDDLAIEKEKHKAYIETVYHYYGFGLWGVFQKTTGKLIGRCGIELKVLDNEDIYEIGYLLDPDYQGLGYAKEFVSEIIHYCFHILKLSRIVAIIEKSNQRSLKLAETVGMIPYGECQRMQKECFKYEIKNL